MPFHSGTQTAQSPSLADASSSEGPRTLDSSEFVALHTLHDSEQAKSHPVHASSNTEPNNIDTDPTVIAPASLEALADGQLAVGRPGRSLLKGAVMGVVGGLVATFSLILILETLPGTMPTTRQLPSQQDRALSLIHI